MTTLMRNGRDRRSGKPVKGHAILERALLVGTRSADHIRASGHSGRIATGQASTRNRPDTWLHPNASQNVRFLLHRGRPPYMALYGDAAIRSYSEQSGHSARRENKRSVARRSIVARWRITPEPGIGPAIRDGPGGRSARPGMTRFHSALMPACLTTGPHFAISDSMNFPNSAERGMMVRLRPSS